MVIVLAWWRYLHQPGIIIGSVPGWAEHLRVGLIGFGRIGAAHAQAWLDCPGVELAGVCDPDAAARRRIRVTNAGQFHAGAIEPRLRMRGADAAEADQPNAQMFCPPRHTPNNDAGLVQVPPPSKYYYH